MPSSKPFNLPLPYFADSAALFAVIAMEPWAVFLDSGHPYSRQGRYDILAADPVCTLLTHGETTEITQDGATVASGDNPFDLVKQYLALYAPAEAVDCDLPFSGGAIGYFGYDLARRLERLPVIAVDAEHIADMAIGLYTWAVVVDHRLQQSRLVGFGLDDDLIRQRAALFSAVSTLPDSGVFRVTSPVAANMDRVRYAEAFERIQHYLCEGDCYQVNLTQRFAAACDGNPWLAYRLLRTVNAAPFSGYLNAPEAQILCSSPERFLKVENGKVETKPIKGTRPRKPDFVDDQRQMTLLQHSDKDRAENLMIVDLLRNDLSKTCKPGSVKVPKLFAVESYATVHHLVSTVTGELAERRHALDLLQSCFPGGSITGAPKIRAMEIIEELEPNRRGVYCGAIGYVGFNGNMDTNIAIRTLVHAHGTIRFWVGGGIVHDSKVDDEYQECFDKAAALLDVLQRLTAV